jgi:DNA-binding NarL/FixJ family response regulator
MPRVLLVYHHPLFAHPVRAALSTQPTITLVGELTDWTRAEADIARLAPDVVIVEDEGHEAADRAWHALAERQTPWRVIALRLDETTMHIWSGAWRPVERTQDLIDVVTGGV